MLGRLRDWGSGYRVRNINDPATRRLFTVRERKNIHVSRLLQNPKIHQTLVKAELKVESIMTHHLCVCVCVSEWDRLMMWTLCCTTGQPDLQSVLIYCALPAVAINDTMAWLTPYTAMPAQIRLYLHAFIYLTFAYLHMPFIRLFSRFQKQVRCHHSTYHESLTNLSSASLH